MKKKIVALCLVLALAVTAVAGATLAYFTDTEAAENVFTVGNVDVELIESYVHRSAATAFENTNNEKGEYPYPDVASGEHTDEQILAASGEKYKAYLASQTLMPGVHVNKMPYVRNTGKNDAYVRIRVMVPASMDADFLNSSYICTAATKEGEFTRDPNYIAGEITVNGKVVDQYAVYTFTRVKPLAPGEMTRWNVWNTIAMDPEVTNQDLETLIGSTITNNTFGVKVEVDAIQADSFADATAAWAAFDAQKKNSVSTEDYSANAKEGYVTSEKGE